MPVPSCGGMWCCVVCGEVYNYKDDLSERIVVTEEWCSVRGNKALMLNSTAELEDKFLCKMKNLTLRKNPSNKY